MNRSTPSISIIIAVSILCLTSAAMIASADSGDLTETDDETIVVVQLAEIESFESKDDLKAKTEKRQQPVVDHLESLDGVVIRDQFWLANEIEVVVDETKTPLNYIRDHPDVLSIEHSQLVSNPDTQTIYGEMSSTSGDQTYGLELIEAANAWESFNTTGDGVTVAVIDGGINKDHVSIPSNESNSEHNFKGEWHTNYYPNGTWISDAEKRQGTAAPAPFDSSGHGTHVSGTVAGGNETDTAIGVAPGSRLIHSVALYEGAGFAFDVRRSLDWVIEQEPDVVVMSLGAEDSTSSHVQRIDTLRSMGIVVVAASGNSGPDTIRYPASYENSTGVGAVDSSRSVTSYSSGAIFDPEEEIGSEAEDWENPQYSVHVAAPGDSVWSADYQSETGLTRKSGTSMAAPHVGGIVSLMLSNNPDLAPEQVDKVLAQSTVPAEGVSEDRNSRAGYGIANAYNALSHSNPDGYAVPNILSANDTVTTGDNISVTANVSNENILGDSATRDIGFYINGSEVANETVTIDSESNVTVEFEYETSSEDAGERELKIATGDKNQSVSTFVGDSPQFDVSLDPEQNPQNVVVGENTTVNATVEHISGLSGNTSVDFFVNDTTVISGKNTSEIEMGTNESIAFKYTPTEADLDTINFSVQAQESSSSLEVDVLTPGNFSTELATASTVDQGDQIRISQNVTNVGGIAKTGTVNFSVEDSEISNRTLTLDPGESSTISTTHQLAADGYPKLNVSVSSNQSTASETVTVSPTAIFEITDLSAPSEAYEGDSISVSADVTNIGAANGSQNITLSIDGSIHTELTDVHINNSESRTVDLESDSLSATGTQNIIVSSESSKKIVDLDVVEDTSSGDDDSSGSSGGGGGGGGGGAAPAPEPEPEEDEVEEDESEPEVDNSITASESVSAGDTVSLDTSQLNENQDEENHSSGLSSVDIGVAEDTNMDVQITDNGRSTGETSSDGTREDTLGSISVNYNGGDSSSMSGATLTFEYTEDDLRGYDIDSIRVTHERSDGTTTAINPVVEPTPEGYTVVVERESFSTFTVAATYTDREFSEFDNNETKDSSDEIESDSTSSDEESDTTSDDTPGFTFVVSIIALLSALLLHRRTTRLNGTV